MEFDDEDLALIYAAICITIQQYSMLKEEIKDEEELNLIDKILESSMRIEKNIAEHLGEDQPTPRPKW